MAGWLFLDDVRRAQREAGVSGWLPIALQEPSSFLPFPMRSVAVGHHGFVARCWIPGIQLHLAAVKVSGGWAPAEELAWASRTSSPH